MQQGGQYAVSTLRAQLHWLKCWLRYGPCHCPKLPKGPRLAKSLAAVAQSHASLPLAVYPLLCAMAVTQPEAPRKDCAPLLELMLELQLAHHLPLPDNVRQVLAGQRLTGKARSAVRALLG